MAVRYSGILDGIMAADAANRADDERKSNQEKYDKDQERQDKLWTMQEQKFKADKRLNSLELLTKYVGKHQNQSDSSGGGKKVASLETPEHYIKILSTIGINEDAISRVAGTGAKNLKSVVTQLSGAIETFLKNNGRDAPLPLDIFNEAISGAILTQPTGPTIDMDKVQDVFNIELSAIELLMITPDLDSPSFTIKPGALAITPIASLEDLGKLDKQGIQYSVSLGNAELDKLTKRSAQLVTLSKEGALDDVTMAEQAWVTQRMTEVQGAIASVKDGDNFFPIASLYGTDFMQNVMNSYPGFENAPINPAWKAEAVPMTVPNRAVAQRLLDIGILKVGTEIISRETGRTIKLKLYKESN
tara:strand:- start:1005 stop:2081 length:1077 start_codon:yes stop_codon:yes gene_type:complete